MMDLGVLFGDTLNGDLVLLVLGVEDRTMKVRRYSYTECVCDRVLKRECCCETPAPHSPCCSIY